MMTYSEFKKKYNGKLVDYDKAYGGQCWDLAQQYFTEALGIPASLLGGVGVVSNMLKEPKRSQLLKYFDKIPQTTKVAGDIVIWNYGHIAIMDHWDAKQNINYYLSQNNNNTGKQPTQVVPISDSNSEAFRFKKKVTPQPTVTYYPKCKYTGASIVEGLNSIKVNSSFSNRAIIAKKNGITNYTGTAAQNTKLLSLLKQGKLIKI